MNEKLLRNVAYLALGLMGTTVGLALYGLYCLVKAVV